MATFLLGIDAGTSVIKSIVFDPEGHELAGATRETQLLHPAPKWVEQDMQAVWQAVADTIRESVEKTKCRPDEIVAIGITGQGDGTWLVDEDGHPVRNAILWMDGRTADFVRLAHQNGLSADVFSVTGTALNTSNQALHLRWLETNEAESIARSRAALRAKDWVFLNMTGVISTDESDASHTYFSTDERSYSARIIDLLEIGNLRHLLPPVRQAYANTAPLLPHIASTLGIAAGTPVVAGPFDVAAAALGSGVINTGDACTILGTAGINQMVVEVPAINPFNAGYTMCHAPEGRLIRLLPTMAGAINLQWFVEEFYSHELSGARSDDRDFWAECESQANNVPVGCDGVMYHPYIDPAGERSPFVRTDARAQFTGISINHTRKTLLRAVYEGTVLSAMDCYDHLGTKMRTLQLAGGGARSPFWAQMYADALGCEVAVVEGSEFGARGAAMNAGVAVGMYASYEEAIMRCVRLARSYSPNPAHTEEYRRLLPLYRRTYEAMFPVWQERNKWLEEVQ